MSPRLILIAALLFVAVSLVALWLLPTGEPDPVQRPPSPSPLPAPPPIRPPDRSPPQVAPLNATPDREKLPNIAVPRRVPAVGLSREQREFVEAAEALIPTLNRRAKQCLDDARVPPEEPPTLALRIAAERRGEATECAVKLARTGVGDPYVAACLDDVLEEFECPRAPEGSEGAAVEWELR